MDKAVDRVPRCNPNVDNGKYDLVGLKECITGMEKIFVVIEVLDFLSNKRS